MSPLLKDLEQPNLINNTGGIQSFNLCCCVTLGVTSKTVCLFQKTNPISVEATEEGEAVQSVVLTTASNANFFL